MARAQWCEWAQGCRRAQAGVKQAEVSVCLSVIFVLQSHLSPSCMFRPSFTLYACLHCLYSLMAAHTHLHPSHLLLPLMSVITLHTHSSLSCLLDLLMPFVPIHACLCPRALHSSLQLAMTFHHPFKSPKA